MYPLKLYPVYKNYLWGGHNLERFGKKLPEGTVAECWDVACHPDGMSIVKNGRFVGRSLHGILEENRRELLGTAVREEGYAGFPLLFKWMDAFNAMSVQVHPDDRYAAMHAGGSLGKTEMWYIVSAVPGARVISGLKQGVTEKQLREHLKTRQAEDLFRYMPVRAGDFLDIPPGCLHSLGPGIVAFEIEQNSNITYRLYDYHRAGPDGRERQLHIEEAMAVMTWDTGHITNHHTGMTIREGDGCRRRYLLANRHFACEEIHVDGMMHDATDGTRFYVITVLHGRIAIDWEGGFDVIYAGESVLIPATLGHYALSGRGLALRGYVPDLDQMMELMSRHEPDMHLLRDKVCIRDI